MKYLACFFWLTICVGQSFAQAQTERAQLLLIGPVKIARTVRVILKESNGQWVESERFDWQSDEFDPKGFFTKVMRCSDLEKLTCETVEFANEHDTQGRLKTRSVHDLKRNCTYREETFYDVSGRVKERGELLSGCRSSVRKLYTYDEAGRQLSETSRIGSANGTSQTIKYDVQGKRIEELYFNSYGVLTQKTRFSYQPGEHVTKTIVDGKNQLQARWIEKYDQRGNLLEFEYHSRYGLWKKGIIEYDFDAHGNWSKAKIRREIHDEGPVRVEHELQLREITYY